MSTLTEKKVIGDLVLNEWDQRATRKAGRIENDTGAAATFVIGQVLEADSTHFQPADGTTFGGILLKNLDELANAAGIDNIPILYRGPAIVNRDALVWDAGATQADVIAAMELLGIVLVDEPDNSEVAGE